MLNVRQSAKDVPHVDVDAGKARSKELNVRVRARVVVEEIEDIAKIVVNPELTQNHRLSRAVAVRAKGPVEVRPLALDLEVALAATICKGEIELKHFSVIPVLVGRAGSIFVPDQCVLEAT